MANHGPKFIKIDSTKYLKQMATDLIKLADFHNVTVEHNHCGEIHTYNMHDYNNQAKQTVNKVGL